MIDPRSSILDPRSSIFNRMSKEPEIVEAVVRACRLLQAFNFPEEVVTLKQLVERKGLSKTTCFRLSQSLVKGGLIERVSKGAYRSQIQPLTRSGFKLGFAAQTTDSEFSRDVSQSIHRVAAREHIQLIAVHNPTVRKQRCAMP